MFQTVSQLGKKFARFLKRRQSLLAPNSLQHISHDISHNQNSYSTNIPKSHLLRPCPIRQMSKDKHTQHHTNIWDPKDQIQSGNSTDQSLQDANPDKESEKPNKAANGVDLPESEDYSQDESENLSESEDFSDDDDSGKHHNPYKSTSHPLPPSFINPSSQQVPTSSKSQNPHSFHTNRY